VENASDAKLMHKVSGHNHLVLTAHIFDGNKHMLLPVVSLAINTQCLEKLTRAGKKEDSCVVHTKKSRKNPALLIWNKDREVVSL